MKRIRLHSFSHCELVGIFNCFPGILSLREYEKLITVISKVLIGHPMAASRDRTNSLALNRRTTSLRLINSFTYSSSTKRASLCDGSNAQIL